MGCAMGTVRYILFFFNFLLALAGLGIVILGIAANSQGSTVNDILHGQLTTPAIIFSIVGGCVFIFAFFGCCGALRESHCMICTYAVMLLTLFLLQVAVAVLAYTYKVQSKDLVTQKLKESFDNYRSKNSSKLLVDNLQQELHCCGSTNPKDPWEAWGVNPPNSCYRNKETTSTKFSEGCIPRLTSWVEEYLEYFVKVAIAVAVVQIVGIVFSLCLANSIRRSELRGYA